MADKIPLKVETVSAGIKKLDEFDVGDSVPIISGGTGATTASGARINLDAAQTSHVHAEGDITDLDHTDVDAIHDNISAEISVITEKIVPVAADLLLIEDSAASNVKKRVQIGNLPGGGGGGEDYIFFKDEKATESGGDFISGAWRTRDITDEVSDSGGHASLASNQITLAAGTYRCFIECPAYEVRQHKARLWNITDSSLILPGTTEFADINRQVTTSSVIVGIFTLLVSKVIEIQHRCGTTGLSTGFGRGGVSAMEPHLFVVAEFFKRS